MKNTTNALVTLAILLLSHNVHSQDIITKKNGTDLKTKVIEISSSEVKYKNYDNLNGPTYLLLKSEILMIRYENGKKDIFTEQSILQDIPPNDNAKAKVVVYRQNDFVGSFISYKLYANNKVIAKIVNGCLYELSFPSGAYEFMAKTESRSVAVKKLESGKTYYLRCGLKMGAFVGRPNIMFIEESTALGQTAQLTKTEPDLLLASQIDSVSPGEVDLISRSTSLSKSKNSVYVELLGAAGAFSANYERNIFNFKKSNISVRAGIGTMPSDGFLWLSFPISCNYIMGNKNNHFEAGIGVTPDTYSDLFLNFIAGYRYQKPTKGFLFKANMNFMYEPSWGIFLPLPGITLGYSF